MGQTLGFVQDTPKIPKPAFIKLTFNHILQFIGMIAWGVGSIYFNMQAKLERDEDLEVVI